jgi:hypothetical protein
MNKKSIIFWILSLLIICVISVLLGKSWFCNSSTGTNVSTIQSMGNDNKWTRCFRASDGSIYFEDHRMSQDGGKSVIAQQAIDVEDINAAPERAVFVSNDVFYALDGPTKIVSPGVYTGKAWRSDDGLKTMQEEQVTFHVPEGPLRDPEEGGLTWTNHKIIERSGTCYSTIIEVEPNVVFMLVDQWYCRISLDR